MIEAALERILTRHGIANADVSLIKSADREHLFFINDEYVLRISEGNNDSHIEKLRRIEGLASVQRLVAYGAIESGTLYYYLLSAKLKGIDLIDAASSMSLAQMAELGGGIGGFLDALHVKAGSRYDIGHYIPIIPGHKDSWAQGHSKYWEYMQKSLGAIELRSEHKAIFNEAFAYLYASAGALDFQQGPALLHNDLHPKNIIVDHGVFSGVIDWECSQYGEPDFELCHFIHWCVYPPKPDINLKPFLSALMAKRPRCAQAPRLHERLTIYQIEHEIMQIIWSKGKAQDERAPKLVRWMNGQVRSAFE